MADLVDPSPWLGHRDLCPIQWGESCDCEPGQPSSADDQEGGD